MTEPACRPGRTEIVQELQVKLKTKTDLIEVEKPVSWILDLNPDQASFVNIYSPTSFGKFGICVPEDILHDLAKEGVHVNDRFDCVRLVARENTTIDVEVPEKKWLKMFKNTEAYNMSPDRLIKSLPMQLEFEPVEFEKQEYRRGPVTRGVYLSLTSLKVFIE